MTKEKCVAMLDEAVDLIEEMKEILEDESADSPVSFFEFGIDAQERIARALQEALLPILRLNTSALAGQANSK